MDSTVRFFLTDLEIDFSGERSHLPVWPNRAHGPWGSGSYSFHSHLFVRAMAKRSQDRKRSQSDHYRGAFGRVSSDQELLGPLSLGKNDSLFGSRILIGLAILDDRRKLIFAVHLINKRYKASHDCCSEQ